MRVERLSWLLPDCGELSKLKQAEPDLIIYFGSRTSLASGAAYKQLKAACPGAMVLGCTTGGQIDEHDAVDDEIAGIAIRFDETKIRLVSEVAGSPADLRMCGRVIGERLLTPDLAGIFILSDGLNVNGSELVAGITEVIGPHIPLTGGFAGDGSQFEETLVGANCAPRSRMVAGIGFYGSAIQNRTRQRRRMGRFRSMAHDYAFTGQRVVRTRWRTGPRSLRAVSGAMKPRGCPAPASCFRCKSRIRIMRITGSFERSSRSTVTRGP